MSLAASAQKRASPQVAATVAAQTAAASAPGVNKCICKVCTCGRHKCKIVVQNNTRLEGASEYTNQYHSHPVPAGPRLKHVQAVHVPVGVPLSSATENRDQYKAHALPPKLPKRTPDVSALWNQAHFDGLSVSKGDYKPWPVQPHRKPQKVESPDKLMTSPDKLMGETTNKHDYKSWPVPPPYVKKRAEYVPSKAKLDGTSTHKEAYQVWPVSRPAPPPVQVYRPANEDRDFRSENRSSFVPHQTARRKVTAVEYHPVVTRFEGTTTNKEDYKQWPVARRVEYKDKYVPQPSAPLDGQTTYRDAYLPKSVPRYVHEKLKYVKPDTHFDGQSTQRTDFGPKALSTRVDFAPHNVYKQENDTRDFLTQTHLAHNRKPLVLCEVIRRNQTTGRNVAVDKDGHTYWANSGAATPARGPTSLAEALTGASDKLGSLKLADRDRIKPPTPPSGLARVPALPTDPIAPAQQPRITV